MRIIKNTILLYVALFFLMLLRVSAQCPATIQLNISNNTGASCPSSGSVTIGSNAPVGSLQYMITAGPSGAPLNQPQSDSTFNALLAGSYTLKAVCALNPSVFATINFSITNGYTTISDISTSIVSNCGSGAAGGTVTANGVTGGTAPYQYSLIQNSDPNYADNLSVYGATTTFSPTAYGVYQLRVKDACGQLYTKTVQLAQSLPPVTIGLNFYNDNACGSANWDATFYLYDPASNTVVDVAPYFNAGGITIKVYQGTGTAANCGKSTLLGTFTNLTSQAIQLPKANGGLYYFEVTTPCGNTTTRCYDASELTHEYAVMGASTSGCGNTSPATTMNIYSNYLHFVHYPLTVTVTPKTGGTTNTYVINDGSISITGLPLDDYIVTVTDPCGLDVYSNQFLNPANTGAPISYFVIPGDFDCQNGHLTSQEGTVRVGVGINGFLPNLPGATAVITSGPSNVGVAGAQAPAGSGVFYWQNMLPGTYNMSITTSCGTTPLSFTVTAPWGVLVQHIKATASSFCGGSGTVQIDAANTAYTGYGNVSYTLMNAATNTAVGSNVTGVFTNLPAGDYYINMNILEYCLNTTYSISSNVVTVNAAGTAAQITKKTGVICEDANGNLLSTGTAYLELAGAPPIMLEYKLSTSSTWTTYITNAPASVVIGGLLPGQIYDVRATSCGISSATQVSIGKLDPVRVTNTVNPCLHSPYTLSVPEMAGATYSWTNPAGVIVSNSYNYSIPDYNASYDGLYACTINFGTCVIRVVTVTLNSVMCAQPLPIRLTSFTASNQNCKAVLDWTAIYHNTDKEFIVERSLDGKIFTALTTIPVQIANGKYNYTDASVDLNQGSAYYRLKLADVDGSFIYSATQVVKGCANGNVKGDFTIVPNPATNGQNINMIYNGAKVSGYYTIMNTTGQTIQRSGVQAIGADAGNTINISLQQIKAGVYIIMFTTVEGNVIGREKLVVY